MPPSQDSEIDSLLGSNADIQALLGEDVKPKNEIDDILDSPVRATLQGMQEGMKSAPQLANPENAVAQAALRSIPGLKGVEAFNQLTSAFDTGGEKLAESLAYTHKVGPKTAAGIGTVFQNLPYMAPLGGASSDAKAATKVAQVAAERSPEELMQLANTTSRAVSPFLDPQTTIQAVTEEVMKRGRLPAERFADVQSSVVEKLANGDRSFTNIAKNITRDIIPIGTQKEPRAGNIIARLSKGYRPADVMNQVLEQHGEQILGRPIGNAVDEIQALKKFSEGLEGQNRRIYGSMIKKATEDIPQGVGAGVRQVDPTIAEMASKGKFRDFASQTTDPSRLAEVIDPTGTFHLKVMRPFFTAEQNAGEKSTSLINNFQIKYPDIKPGSYESKILQKYAEGTLKGNQWKSVTPKIRQAFQEMRGIYNERLTKINDVRAILGKAPIPFRKDFATHFREISALESLFGDMTKAPSAEVLAAQDFGSPNSPFFKSALQRLGGKYTEDAVQGLNNYIRSSVFVEDMTPAAIKLKTNASVLPPRAARALKQLSDETLGSKMTAGFFDEVLRTHPKIQGFLNWARNREVANFITGNMSTVMQQTGSVPLNVALTGPENFAMGIVDAMSPTRRAFADANSLVVRASQQGFEIASRSGFKKIQDFLNIPLNIVNNEISRVGFFSGLRKARQLGLDGDAAIDFADRIANKVNVLYLRSNAPRALRSRFMQSLFPLQRFTFNGMNFLRHDLPEKGAESYLSRIMTPQGLKRGALFASTAAALDAMYTSVGLRMPANPADFIPLMHAFRTGSSLSPTLEIGKDAGLGIYDLLKGDAPKAGSRFKRVFYRTALPFGGVQIERLMRGHIFPSGESNKKGKLPNLPKLQ